MASVVYCCIHFGPTVCAVDDANGTPISATANSAMMIRFICNSVVGSLLSLSLCYDAGLHFLRNCSAKISESNLPQQSHGTPNLLIGQPSPGIEIGFNPMSPLRG